MNYKPYRLWFDANWDKEWTRAHATGAYNAIKALDPNVLINNRLDTKEASGGSHKDCNNFSRLCDAGAGNRCDEYGLPMGKLYYDLQTVGMETK
jgi:hypothetical protein